MIDLNASYAHYTTEATAATLNDLFAGLRSYALKLAHVCNAVEVYIAQWRVRCGGGWKAQRS